MLGHNIFLEWAAVSTPLGSLIHPFTSYEPK